MRLFGHYRAVELLQSADVDGVLADRIMHRIFAEIADYGEEFRGLQELVRRGKSRQATLFARIRTAETPLGSIHTSPILSASWVESGSTA